MSTPLVVHHGPHRITALTEAGESWAAAAERAAAAPVWARDLSGEVKEFDTDPRPIVALRPMVPGDLSALTGWLRHDHLQRWFAAEDDSEAGVRERYLPAIEGDSETRVWVVECNGRSIGFAQDYVLEEHPGYRLPAPEPGAVGLDYAIGEPAFLGRGLGVRLVWALLCSIRSRRPAQTYVAAPDHRNRISLRTLAKVGFTEGVWFDEPQPDGSTVTMVGCSLDVAAVLG